MEGEAGQRLKKLLDDLRDSQEPTYSVFSVYTSTFRSTISEILLNIEACEIIHEFKIVRFQKSLSHVSDQYTRYKKKTISNNLFFLMQILFLLVTIWIIPVKLFSLLISVITLLLREFIFQIKIYWINY